MISEEEAGKRIVETVRPLPVRKLPITKSLGCFAAEDHFARLPLPTFDNSAMDGYAVVASSCNKSQRLRVIGEQPAGVDRRLRISRGEAIRIFTGAPVPAGADAVIMQEDVTRDGEEIIVNVDVETGEFIRRRGCDLAEGQMILAKSERIRAATAALLASQGFADVTVGGQVNAAIISTGDELVKQGEKIQQGQIYDSNSVLLDALVRRCGAVIDSVEHCGDERESLLEAVKRGTKNQILIISGGVSVGEHDLVKDALRGLGAQIDIWRVAIKPGKPFLFGKIGECAVFGLPGNPVSTMVTFELLVVPALDLLSGAEPRPLPSLQATLAEPLQEKSGLTHFLPARLEWSGLKPHVKALRWQGSGDIAAVARANCFVVVPADRDKIAAGETVSVLVRKDVL